MTIIKLLLAHLSVVHSSSFRHFLNRMQERRENEKVETLKELSTKRSTSNN